MQGTSVFKVMVRDGDTGSPHPIELFLVGDHLGYFKLDNGNQDEDGVLTATLATSEILIDRENINILNEGGLYAFRVSKYNYPTFL